MQQKSRQVILLFLISLMAIPSLIYGTSNQQNTSENEGKVTSCKPVETPKPCKPCETPQPTTLPLQPDEEDINFPYISGYADQMFKPNQVVTREEMATMLARLITKNRIPTEKNRYDDLYEGRFSTDAVNYITQLGIMKSLTSTTFGPNQPITIQEFNEIVEKLKPYIKNPNVELPNGNGNLTRVDAVIFLNQLFRVRCNTNLTSSPFKDVATHTPGYNDILCATQSKS